MKASPFRRNYRTPQKCGICMENKSVSDFMFINGCLHSYCSKCVGRYVTEKIRNNVVAIACPYPGCEVGTLTPEMCKPVLSRVLFDHWYNVLMKHKFSCRRRFCGTCKSIWHPKMACNDAQQLRQDYWEKEDLLLVELANKQGWNRCPFCGFYVEKVSGCSNILCR
ncbi:hypothetical protein IEQ34_015520 [Dendrobium chrysotoxum]|uniref:RING-type domain-containing protein n=1 Tax=Dendrobium chrysotoxum TaxID=161865 RepID=A0AAV7GIF1_DENCH|nr:hypothetical protein IEQ34_015520 [Dendrobium chrysotoxum]